MITVRDQVIAFFARNPGEALSRSDVAIKFDCTMCTAWESLRNLRADGLLVSEPGRGPGKPLSYRPGPALRSLGQ